MSIETAAPAVTPTAPPIDITQEVKDLNASIDADEGENKDSTEASTEEQPPKKEKTPEEREIARLRRALDRKTRQREEARAQLRAQQVALPNGDAANTTAPSQSDNEALTLSRKDLQALIEAEAKKLAPSITKQESEIEHRRAVVNGLAKAWGKERFDELASDLDEALDGLADEHGKPKAAANAIFESETPALLIEYLADPEHADEAEAIGRMSELQAGRAIGKLEEKLKAKKGETKPQASSAPAPLEPVRAQGAVTNKRLLDLSDEEFAKRRKEQIKRRR